MIASTILLQFWSSCITVSHGRLLGTAFRCYNKEDTGSKLVLVSPSLCMVVRIHKIQYQELVKEMVWDPPSGALSAVSSSKTASAEGIALL